MKNEDFDSSIGFRCFADEKQALKDLAKSQGFNDLASFLRTVIQDLLEGNKPAMKSPTDDLAVIEEKLSLLIKLIGLVRDNDLEQLKAGIFMLGTEQIIGESGELELVNQHQTKRFQLVFKQFSERKQDEKY